MPDLEEQAEELARQREFLSNKRLRLYASAEKALISADSVNERNHHMYAGSYERLKKLEEDFDACQDEITELNTRLPAESRVPVDKIQEKFEDIIECARMRFSAFNRPPAPSFNANASSSHSNAAYADAKLLGPISVPKFSGNADNWPTFFNLYNAAVHNTHASNTTKFNRLVSLLSGEPLSMVGTMDITEHNYLLAYDMLKERYQRAKQCILRQYRGLLDLPMVKSAADMSLMLAKLREHTHALTALQHREDSYGNFLVAVIHTKLSTYYRRRLDDFIRKPNEYPTLKEVTDFIVAETALDLESFPSKSTNNKVFMAQASSSRRSSFQDISQRRRSSAKSLTSPQKATSANASASNSPQSNEPTGEVVTLQSSSSPLKCYWCGGDHKIYSCDAFKSLSITERLDGVKEKRLCENCLSTHQTDVCKSPHSCKVCSGSHHTFLHQDSDNAARKEQALSVSINVQPAQDPDAQKDLQVATHSAAAFHANAEPPATYTVLPTVRLLIRSPKGITHSVRAILDSGAQCSFLASNIAQLMGLKVSRDVTSVTGLAFSPVHINGCTHIDLLNDKKDLVIPHAKVVVLNRLTCNTPSIQITSAIREFFANYTLSDPCFDRPGKVDMLIGADIFANILTGFKVSQSLTGPVGLGTAFGLAIMGSVPIAEHTPTSPSSANHVLALFAQEQTQLSDQLEKFWRLEEPGPVRPILTPEEEEAENYYVATTIQQPNGRYQVRLPKKSSHPPLGQSRARAESRFASLERHFTRDPVFHTHYKKFMQDYKEDKFMSLAPAPATDEQHFFLPHQGVLRASSSTTKLRVVFDASAKSSNSVSLNDILLPGPKLHNDIRDVIMNFRRHPVVFTADIRQMFLMIDLHPDDRRFQYILWRPSPDEEIQVYTLDTVTFGLTPSPFLSNRTLKQLARDHGHKYPRAAKILLEDTFVDDICSGCSSPEEAAEILQELIALLALGGFRLRKWTSSHPEILKDFPIDELELPALDDPENPRFTILGLQWLPEKDAFTYTINLTMFANTKRAALSVTSTIYDPNGWVAPVVFSAKCFLQELWRNRLDWDDRLPSDMGIRWRIFLARFTALKNLKIPRLLHRPGSTHFQLHIFSDASELGYGTCLYLRSADSDDGPAYTSLIIAKTRVAPIKQVSIPRLELCAATLAVDVLNAYLARLESYYPVSKVVCWSDSTTVLSWIRLPPYRLQTFVANRVAKIQDLRGDIPWRFVKSSDNPADLASRGMSPLDLPFSSLWFKGPSWLSEPESTWPVPVVELKEADELPEIKTPATALAATVTPPTLPEFSSWEKAVRVMAYVARFYNRIRKNLHAATAKPHPVTPVPPADREDISRLTSAEKIRGERWLLASVQLESFSKEIELLRKKPAGADKKTRRWYYTPRVRGLSPEFDSNGLIRVGGRLGHSNLDLDARKPILLTAKHPLVKLLVEKAHKDTICGGPRLMEATLSRRYWILAARNLIRKCVHSCHACFRAKPRNQIPRMGDLPAERVQQYPAFTHTGMDLSGPFSVKAHRLRFPVTVSVYICHFVCMSSKAVHLEIVHDLSTPAFIAALHRFSSRRGLPRKLFSDCGSNFTGAANFYAKLKEENQDPEFAKFLLDNEIQFKFNPPAAPHQGGLWESAVKSVKAHLRRALGTTVLYMEEFNTLLCRIEALLNSRPLTALSADPHDLLPLTPAHFLIGRPMTSPPVAEYEDREIPLLDRWHLVEALFQNIWRRWSTEYLHTLQPRGKWTKDPPNIELDTLVLIQDPDLPPLVWKMGRVIKVHPGTDKRVRVATVRTATGQLTRPVHKLYPLPVLKEATKN